MGIPDHLTHLLRNLYAGQEATVRTGHGTTDWFHIGKGVRQGCIILYMGTSDDKKAFDKIQHTFVIKILQNVGIG